MTVAYAWAPITKTEEQDDGTLMVYGPAASSDLDRDQQRLNAEWLDRAMPRWFAEGANVREQHDGRRAVGVGVGLAKGDDGATHLLAARIVDPVAVSKVKYGVLKGFSVGIKSPRIAMGKADAPGGEVVGGDIIEVSVVDRPCNPTTLFEIAKADGDGGVLEAVEGPVVEKTDAEAFGIPAEVYERLPEGIRTALTSLAAAGAAVSTADTAKTDTPTAADAVISSPTLLLKLDGPAVDEDTIRGLIDARVTEQLAALGKADLSAAGRREAASSGAAMPDGSYPIKTKADLRKAIKAVGRGGADHDKIRKHIIQRAKALGLEAMVPDNWNSDGSLKTAAKADAPDPPDPEIVEKAESILREVRALAPSLTKADGGDGENDGDGGEEQDINGADQAIACIAQLIIAEAESLAQGHLNEACDIDLLLSAVRSLTWFKQREEAEEEGSPDMALADQPDTAKTDTPAAEPAEDPDPATPDAPQPLTKADVAELVKAAVAEASTASKERIEALEAELAKAQTAIQTFSALPQPGGPVITRTSVQEDEARKSDADRLRAEANDYLAKADQCSDRYLADGYREKARNLLARADA